MTINIWYSTDPKGEYFSRFLENIELKSAAEAQRYVRSALSQACVSAAYWNLTSEEKQQRRGFQRKEGR